MADLLSLHSHLNTFEEIHKNNWDCKCLKNRIEDYNDINATNDIYNLTTLKKYIRIFSTILEGDRELLAIIMNPDQKDKSIAAKKLHGYHQMNREFADICVSIIDNIMQQIRDLKEIDPEISNGYATLKVNTKPRFHKSIPEEFK